MTKTSRLMLPVIAVTSVAWLGVACGPPGESEPEATATVAADPATETEHQPKWKDCMAVHDNCIAGARAQVKRIGGTCGIDVKPWFATETEVIDVSPKGRVFFLVQWEQQCRGAIVHLTHEGDHPWENDCHVEPWELPEGQSFMFMACEVRRQGPPADYRFCLEIDDPVPCGSDRTGGTVRVRGSGKPPDDHARTP